VAGDPQSDERKALYQIKKEHVLGNGLAGEQGLVHPKSVASYSSLISALHKAVFYCYYRDLNSFTRNECNEMSRR
jgi:hypothetical protein